MTPFSPFSDFIYRRLKKKSQHGISTFCYKIGVASTAIGLAFTICAALIMTGFHSNIESRITDLVGDISIVTNDIYTEQEPLNLESLNFIKSDFQNNIDEIKAVAFKIVLLQNKDEFEGITLYGLDNTANQKNIEQYLCKGRLPILNRSNHENEITISEMLAKKLNLEIGDSIILSVLQNPPLYRNVTVCGIFNSNFPDFDEKFAFCDIRFIQKLNKWSPTIANELTIFLKSKKHTLEVTQNLNSIIKPSFKALSIQDKYPDILQWISILYKNTFIFIILLLIMVNTNLAAIIATQLMDRLYMIGILKAMGTSAKQLIQIFAKYNLQMIGKGILYGNILGLSICGIQHYAKVIKLNSSVYYIDYLPVNWNWSLIGLINFTVIITSLIVLTLTQMIILQAKTILEKRE